MTEQPPASLTATQALGSTTVVFGWVEESRVEEVLHASDGFQALLGITLAGAGGMVAALVTLAAAVQHPVTLYLILAVTVTITLVAGGFGAREYFRYRKVRRSLGAAAARVPVPVLLVTPGSPSFTVGGQQSFAVGGQQPFGVSPTVTATPLTVTTPASSATVAPTATTAPEEATTQDAAPAVGHSETSPPREIALGSPEWGDDDPDSAAG